MDVHGIRAITEAVRGEVRKAVVGQDAIIDLMLTSLLVGGHILLEGVPGTAKTLLTRAFAAGLALHAPRELSGAGLVAWLQRVGLARAVTVDCEDVLRRAADPAAAGRQNSTALVRLARDIHQWKGEIVDGRSRHPGDH